MIHKKCSLTEFLADLQWLYEQAIEKDQLAVALRIKELQIKHTLHKHTLSLQDLSDEELYTLLLALDRPTSEASNDTSLKDKN